MEYLSGSDLAHVLRQKGPMAVSDAVGVVLQACEAMAEAHALGIVHRDLKPANLFVTKRRDGTPLVKVLDFGISKMSTPNAPGSNESLTSSGLIMGSPGYMSPEQVRNARLVAAIAMTSAIAVIGGASVYALRSRAPARPAANASQPPLAPSSASAGDAKSVETLPVTLPSILTETATPTEHYDAGDGLVAP